MADSLTDWRTTAVRSCVHVRDAEWNDLTSRKKIKIDREVGSVVVIEVVVLYLGR